MAFTLDELRALAESLSLQSASIAGRDGLELNLPGASGPLRIVILLEQGGRSVRIRTIGYLYAPADHRNIGDLLQGFDALGRQLPQVRFIFDSREGEIVVSAVIDAGDGRSDQAQLRDFLRAHLDMIDRLRPGLIHAAERLNIVLGLARAGASSEPGVKPWLAALARSRGATKKFAATPYTPDAVDCAVFSQREVRPGDSVLVQVFAYLPGYADEAREQAQEYDEEAKKLGGVSLTTEILRGSTLTFELVLRDAAFPQSVQNLVWRGRTQSVQFEVAIPSEGSPKNLIGKVLISQETVPIGQVLFKIKIVGQDAAADRTFLPTGEAQRYRKAFISYASKDRPEVLRRVQMLSTVGISYFQDVFDLEPGDHWARKLYELIDQSNVLFLFWSSAARDSEWVKREWQYGLEKKGKDFIHPVIIEGPPAPLPPPELADLHFADRMLYFINPR